MIGLTEAEELFAAALLQDMAVPLLAKELPTRYQSLFESRNDGTVRLSQLEEEEFGWTHAEAGATMARGWKLPESFASMIENHTQLDLDSENASPTQNTIGLAALLPSNCDTEWAERDSFTAAYSVLSGDKTSPIREILAAVDRDFEEFAPVLKLTVPAKTLVDSLHASAPTTA
jgi:HD-like signal output (HDOD) protein